VPAQALFAFFLTVALPVWLAIAQPSLAQAGDDFGDFGLEEVDPDLPAKIKKWNADCLSCHSEEGVENPPREGMDLKLLATLTLDVHRFEPSDHGEMACKDCHTEAYVPYPHLPKAIEKIKGCVECHEAPAKVIVPEFKKSVHAIELGEAFTCLSCHDSHTMKKASKLGSPHLATVQDNTQCLQCHGDDATYAKWKPKEPRPDMTLAHDWLPEMDRHFAQVRCIDCHSPLPDMALSHLVEKKEKAVSDCLACHTEDSQLAQRLYKPMVQKGVADWAGFSNAPWLPEVYVMGSNRNIWLELAALSGLSLAALLVIGRWLWRRWRKRQMDSLPPDNGGA
jgi:hypothetical protein